MDSGAGRQFPTLDYDAKRNVVVLLVASSSFVLPHKLLARVKGHADVVFVAWRGVAWRESIGTKHLARLMTMM